MTKLKQLLYVLAVLQLAFISSYVNASEPFEIDATQLFAKEVCEAFKASSEPCLSGESRAEAPIEPKLKQVGDVESFWSRNIITREFELINAVLEAIGEHCYVYVEATQAVSPSTAAKIAESFDREIYPVDTKYFGAESRPGIDKDRRITLLLLDINDGYNGFNGFVSGYFYGIDTLPLSKVPEGLKSNQREMLYLDTYPSKPGSERFLGTIAHEFQHMIHFNHDKSEYVWVNEACSQLAPFLCGYGHPSQLKAYQETPDNSLTAWSSEQMTANYGQVYLWLYYIYYRLQIENSYDNQVKFLRNLVASPERGMRGMTCALNSIGRGVSRTFDNLCIALYANNKKLGKGRRYYLGAELQGFKLSPCDCMAAYPSELTGDVKLWSADAIKLDLSRAKPVINVEFSGESREFEWGGTNAYTVALVLLDSLKPEKSEIHFLKTKKSEDYKEISASMSLSIGARFGSGLVIIVSRASEFIDDRLYANEPSLRYKLKVSNSNAY